MNRDALAKVLHSIIKIPIQFALAWALPTIMTTKYYGSYDFVLNAFNRINSLIEGGSLTAFYVKYSKNKDEKLVSFYAVLLLLFLPVLLIFSGIFYPVIENKIYLDFFSYMLTVIQSWNVLALSFMTKLFDAKNRTHFIEKYKNIILLLTLIILVILVYNPIPLNQVLCIIVIFQLFTTGVVLINNILRPEYSKEIYSEYLKYFYNYCKPLYVYLSVSVVSILIGRALLQVLNIPEQQSYYALAFKFISVSLIVLSAAIPILTRELSRQDDLNLIKATTRQNLFLVVLLGIMVAALLYFFASPLILLLGGQQFFDSIEVLKYLVFVPVLQISNQVLGSFHYSVGLTRRYSRAGIIASLLAILWIAIAFVLNRKGVISFDAIVVAITYTLNQLGRFILLFRSFILTNDKRG